MVEERINLTYWIVKKHLVIITIGTLLMVMFGCIEDKGLKKEQTASIKVKLDGFWRLSFSHYEGEKTSQQEGCLIPDAPIETLFKPYALGSHLLIREDSISLFRYPYAYNGTFKYETRGTSLWIALSPSLTSKFVLQKNEEGALILNFEEQVTSTCLLSAKASYEPFVPNSVIIKKLLRNKISCDSLMGKWWHLRKEITYEDGGEPTVLNFPKGMPDSLFVSPKILNQDTTSPFIELELDDRSVKMFIEEPSKHSYILTPAMKNDELLFSRFIDYGEEVDTIYEKVIYEWY
ncbi:MAG: hypothetical protein ACRBFS_01795 [Aureispira sp.]